MGIRVWALWLLALATAQAAELPVAVEELVLQGELDQPSSVVADAAGRLYVLDGTHDRVRVYSETGVQLASFGSDMLKGPLDLALGEEGLLVADTGHERLVLFSPEGRLLQSLALPDADCSPDADWDERSESRHSAAGAGIASQPTKGLSDEHGNTVGGGFSPRPGADRGLKAAPTDEKPPACTPGPAEPVAVALQDGLAYWADRRGHRICRTRLSDGATLSCFGGRGASEGRFQYPYQLVFDRDAYLHAVDIANARVQVFDKTGRYFAQISRFGLDPGELFRPAGAAMDREADTLFVSDGYFGTVSVFSKGEFRGLLQGQDGKPLTLDAPTGLSFRDGKLYLAETGGSRVHRYRLEWRTVALAPVDGETIQYSLPAGEGLKSAALPAPGQGDKHVEVSRKDCILCHLSWAGGAPESVKGPDEKGALPDVSYRMCYSCHNGAIMDSRIEIHRGGQHASIYDSDRLKAERKKVGKRKDKLPEEFPTTASRDLSCGTCHTPHTDKPGQDKLYQGHRNAWLRIPNEGGNLCERCHESKAQDARKLKREVRGHNHPLAVRLEPAPVEGAPGYTRIAKLAEGLPGKVGEAGGALGHKNELICQSCHQVHGGHGDRQLLALDRSRGELCSQCHAQQYSGSREDARRKGVHPVNVKPEETMKLQGKPVVTITCGSCHRVHNGNAGTALLPEGIQSTEQLCRNCHQRQHADGKEAARKKGVHPVGNSLDDPVEIAGKRIDKVGCLTCHSVHHGKPDTAALVEADGDGQLCSHCHDNKQTVVGTDHDLRITAKDKPNRYGQLPRQAGVCGSCHSLHRGKGDRIRLFAAKPVQGWQLPDKMDETGFRRDRLCLNCHQPGGLAEKKVVKHFSHPHQDLVLRSDKNRMPLLNAEEKADEFGTIGCITCHEPHLWRSGDKSKDKGRTIAVSTNKENLEGRNLDSFLRHKGVSGSFCVDCHGMEGLVKYKYFHDPNRARSKGVDYLK